ncbi:hypothetical protein HID58_089514 [Brassica napus]|uniref:Uncharacterized protein n=1 Tax=Brassica napus TaxID=3708 RepID=A0ABQ7Y1R6_BRANA|nr:uncharacterized protein LOC106419093 [Brassica napus]KAH0861253.1 hypothetical protein HID58_089514 [Brassica napus]
MINLRIPILVSFMFFLVFISSSLLFATPIFAARVGHSLVQEEATKIPQYNRLEESEEPEIPEDPEVPEEPEEPEELPKESEEGSFEFPSWIPSFPFPGTNGGLPKTEKTKPTSVISEATSSGSNKKP